MSQAIQADPSAAAAEIAETTRVIEQIDDFSASIAGAA